ncbi:MAG: asparagine synthase C-terminal domain-containing protein [Thaumarchaeota archaeon]|nr:asparagine synthase C-terminal domain-containing protein [Nitrososphaerota archaeon]
MDVLIIENFLDRIKQIIINTIQHEKIIIPFSGGVDSTFLAILCNNLHYDVTLLTIGFKNCHDVLFAKKISNMIKLPHKIYEINNDDEFNYIKHNIKNEIVTDSLSWLENCIAFYYMSKASQKFGFDVIVTANGIDELFCGYDIYRRIGSHNNTKLLQMIDTKLKNEINMLDKAHFISSQFHIRFIHPFLFCDFIKIAKQIPLSYKIRDGNDFLRKHIIRTLALEIGAPKISAYKRKKSMQYGSRIHKFI